VREADEARYIGPSRAADSYLNIKSILAVARDSGAQAIHPGYGFLSENAEFAERCAEAGMVFIGPSVDAIRAMGSKAESKILMEKAGVPLVPGWHGTEVDDTQLADEALRIGYPVLIKASAGGGGRGMRVVNSEAELAEALAAARRESQAAFGDSRLLLEKYLTKPRHVEVQVFGDHYGKVLALFERDCSIQRRHQKVIEEAPAPGISAQLRHELADAAITAAKAVNYTGAGTVEFIMEDGKFYFMEMNTRLQVEHPVTELITGLDLVEWQFLVASGERLPLNQEDLKINGHAIEARLCAEDPARDFMPSLGKIHHLREPAEIDGLRIDSGIVENGEVTPFYDPMLAKIIVHGKDRDDAVRHLQYALNSYEIAGITTNLGMLLEIANHRDFQNAVLDTGFIPRNWNEIVVPPEAPSNAALTAAALAVMMREPQGNSPWEIRDGFRLQEFMPRTHRFATAQGEFELTTIAGKAPGLSRVTVGLQSFDAWMTLNGTHATLRLDHGIFKFSVIPHGNAITVMDGNVVHEVRVIDPMASTAVDHHADRNLTAPIPARITAMRVQAGDVVVKGQILVVLEAMKMEIPLTAPRDGTIEAIFHQAGDMVGEGEELARLSEEEE